MSPSQYPEFSGRSAHSFYTVERAPVHSVMLVRDQQEALNYPCGRIELGFLEDDGFVTNLAFDHNLQHYSEDYEETQGFSPTFNRFHERLAREVIDRFDLHGKRIIEIGCGKGDFLNMLCDYGKNSGVGFDPAYRPERDPFQNDQVEFHRELYTESQTQYSADFICCKMTLEHIPEVVRFVSMVRKSIGDREGVTVFFQIPEIRRVLNDLAFWDIYYEHCSYFSCGSLARTFRKAGFEVRDLWTDYDDQYLMIEAVPASGAAGSASPLPNEEPVSLLADEVKQFEERIKARIESWRSFIQAETQAGRRTVLWGGGSKAVAFLTTLGFTHDSPTARVEAAVDINPHKEGTYLVGTGQPVVLPQYLKQAVPDTVIVMNPIYRDEIASSLGELSLNPRLVMIDDSFD